MSTIDIVSIISPPARVVIDPYGPNPLAEDYKQVNPATYGISEREAGPAPKMFAGGTQDLPAFTASGIDPRLLLKLPYGIRHATAAEPDMATVHGIFEQYTDEPTTVLEHEGWSAAIGRIRNWAAGRMDLPGDAYYPHN